MPAVSNYVKRIRQCFFCFSFFCVITRYAATVYGFHFYSIFIGGRRWSTVVDGGRRWSTVVDCVQFDDMLSTRSPCCISLHCVHFDDVALCNTGSVAFCSVAFCSVAFCHVFDFAACCILQRVRFCVLHFATAKLAVAFCNTPAHCQIGSVRFCNSRIGSVKMAAPPFALPV